MRRFLIILMPVLAAGREVPRAVILSPGNAQLQPRGLSPRSAAAGQFLFNGDVLLPGTIAAKVAFCGQREREGFSIEVSARLDPERPPQSGRSPVLCKLPALTREPEAKLLPAAILIPPPTEPGGTRLARLRALNERAIDDLDRPTAGPLDYLTLGVLLAERDLRFDAFRTYLAAAALWPREIRLIKLLQDLSLNASGEQGLPPARDVVLPDRPLRTRALAIGISKYQDVSKQLDYAYEDAKAFHSFLTGARGPGASAEVRLLPADAPEKPVVSAIHWLFGRDAADPVEQVILFLAGHGQTQGQTPYLLTRRASAEDPRLNALPLTFLDELLSSQTGVLRLILVLDICHAGDFAKLRRTRPPIKSEYLGIFATLADDARKDAYESPFFGGGHGALTYFLMRQLAAPGPTGRLWASDIRTNLPRAVRTATSNDQEPEVQLCQKCDFLIADLSRPGPPFDLSPPPIVGRKELRRGRAARTDILEPIPADPPPPGAGAEDLENAGELILLHYLRGEEDPVPVEIFQRGEQIYERALQFEPGSPRLEARRLFFRGRRQIFERRFPRTKLSEPRDPDDRDHAIANLEESVRLEPTGAYAYNALGIAYLEWGDPVRAAAVLRDAIAYAPRWAYARHNLALALSEQGNLQLAARTYLDAIARNGSYSYLWHNLALVQQKMNQPSEAARYYREALQRRRRPESLVGLGSVHNQRGRRNDALPLFEEAIRAAPAGSETLRSARHNLGLLYAAWPGRESSAVTAWESNGPGYVPSQTALAAYWRARKSIPQALGIYDQLIGRPENRDAVSLRLERAAILAAAGRDAEARAALDALAVEYPDSIVVKEQAARLRKGGGR